MHAIELAAERAVLPGCVRIGARLVVADGRLVRCDGNTTPATATRLAGTVLPGFVDLQVNGGGGRSVDEATPDALDTVAQAVWAGGAVAFLPTLITAPWERLLAQVAAVAQWIERGQHAHALPLGLHVEGPFLQAPGVHDERCFLDPTDARIDALLAAARGHLRLLTLAPCRTGAARATARLRQAGVAVAIGHVTDGRGLQESIDAGATMVTHLWNAMGPLHHREPGIPGHCLDDARLCCALIADGAHVHPAVLRTSFAVLGPDRTLLCSDATAALGMPDGAFQLGGRSVDSRDGVVRDRQGRLAGSALSMGRAARNFLAFVPAAGPCTLARIAAANPARLVGADDFGAIAPGKRALFTCLLDDGRVLAVRG